MQDAAMHAGHDITNLAMSGSIDCGGACKPTEPLLSLRGANIRVCT